MDIVTCRITSVLVSRFLLSLQKVYSDSTQDDQDGVDRSRVQSNGPQQYQSMTFASCLQGPSLYSHSDDSSEPGVLFISDSDSGMTGSAELHTDE